MAKILVVDDRPTNRDLLVTLLGYRGHRMLEAADGETALVVARAERPDLIIADIIMPAMDGYELARQVRSDPVIGQTQIIFYTASYNVAEARTLAQACGVAYFLPKPSEPQQIFDTVNAALAMRSILPVAPVSEAFHHEHMRLLTNALARKVEQLAAEVAERHQAQAALEASEKRFRALIENSSDAISLLGIDGRLLYASPSTRRILGYSVDDLVGVELAQFTHPDDLPALLGVLGDLVQKPGKTVITQYRFRHQDGSWRWLEASINNMLAEPSVGAIVFNYRDITEREQAQAALWQSEERYRTLVETAEDVILLTDLAGQQLFRNKAYYGSLGFTASEAEELDGFARVHPDDLSRMDTSLAQLLAHGTTVSEYRVQHKDGRWIHRLARSSVIYDEAHKPKTILTVTGDVSARKQAEEAVAASEAELRAMFAAMTDILLVLDADGRFLKIAPTNASQLVKAPDELLGRTLHEVFPAAEADNLLHYVRLALMQRQPIHFEYGVTINGVHTWFDGTASAMGADKVFWIGRDISERIQRRGELEAMAAVSASLRSAQTRAELVPVILDQLLKLLNANGTALDIYYALSGEAVIEGARGVWAALAGQRMPAGHGISGQVIATRQPYVSDDITTDARLYTAALAEGIRAAACVPLIAHGQVIGGLWVGRLEPFTAGNMGLITAVADMAANAIHRASLFEQTERRLQRLAALRAIDGAISSSLDLHITLDVLLDQAISQLRVDAASILLLSPHSHSLDFAAGRGFRSRSVERSRLHLGEGFSGRAALERRTLALPDLAQAEPGAALPAVLSDEGFQAYYGVPLMAKGLVRGVLEVFHRAPLYPDSDWVEFLETLAGQAAIAVDNTQLFDGLQRSNVDLSLAYESTIEGWSRALDLRDRETEGHTQRVTEMTIALARASHIDENELLNIRRGALLHDIGKMGIPDSILLKPGPLTADEWVIMRQHPTVAYQLLSPIAYLRPALDIPYCHHEKWDGSGYPRGLKADQIPLSARLFAVVDVWDALRSDRPYRAGWPADKVREHIRSLAGTHFDPAIVEAFLPLVSDESPHRFDRLDVLGG